MSMQRFKEDHYTFPEKCFHNHEVNKNVTINESDEKQNDSKKSCIFSLTSAAIIICIIIGIIIGLQMLGSSSDDVDLLTVIDNIEVFKKKIQTKEEKINKDFEILKVDKTYDVEDVEEIEIVCCPKIRIFSTGLVSQIYPGVIGEYVRLNLSAGHFYASSSKRQVYRKANFQDFFISKPPPTPQLKKYSWGVSRHPDTVWGYIRSSFGGMCPTMGGQWRVYDKTINRWRSDETLHISCD